MPNTRYVTPLLVPLARFQSKISSKLRKVRSLEMSARLPAARDRIVPSSTAHPPLVGNCGFARVRQPAEVWPSKSDCHWPVLGGLLKYYHREAA